MCVYEIFDDAEAALHSRFDPCAGSAAQSSLAKPALDGVVPSTYGPGGW